MEINEENCKSLGNRRKVMKLWIIILYIYIWSDKRIKSILKYYKIKIINIFLVYIDMLKKSSPPWHCKKWKITNFCLIWKGSLIWKFFLPTSDLSHVTELCVTFSVKIWSKEAQEYKSNILFLLYQYSFIDAFFRKSIINIWEINP